MNEAEIDLGAVHLDLVNECLRKESTAIPLTPKAFAVLRHLVEHKGSLVTKQQLLDAVWPKTIVGDAVLKVCVREIRKALGDDVRAPRFIETLHRRGYRFMVGTPAKSGTATRSAVVAPTASTAARPAGRGDVIAQLHRHLARMVAGERQVVFVTGEPGIGKTTVIEAFVDQIPAAADVAVARGQCFDQYGSRESYLPVLDALWRLARGPHREPLLAVLRRHAPTWLVQMPGVVDASELQSLNRELFGATRERMLREMGEALETLTATLPVVLVLEDLHWTDYSTLDLVATLARGRDPARLMVVGTWRPLELILGDHPLRGVKDELMMHRLCTEIPLDVLGARAVGEYLHARFPAREIAPDVAPFLHERSNGHPLFMVNAVDYLVARGLLKDDGLRVALTAAPQTVDVAIPDSLQQMIGKLVERLTTDEVAALEVGSVAGLDFSAATVAVGFDTDVVPIEATLERLVRRGQFLRSIGTMEWPDGTVSARYEFIHSLYRNFLYSRVAPARRLRLHQVIGERGEVVYGLRTPEIAPKLAVHFEQARDYPRAIRYLAVAAGNDTRRWSHRDAIAALDRALTLVPRLPEADQRASRFMLLSELGSARRALGDMDAAANDFTAAALCAHSGGLVDDEARAHLLAASALSWVDRNACLGAVQRAESLAPALESPLIASHVRGFCAYWRFLLEGWSEAYAEASASAVAAARDAGDRRLLALHTIRHAFFEYVRGDYARAAATAAEGLDLAAATDNVFDHLLGHFFRSRALLHAGEWGEVHRLLEAAIERAQRNGHRQFSMLFRCDLAWLSQDALAFQLARDIAQASLDEARALKHSLGEILNLVSLGLAELGLGDLDKASATLDSVTQRCNHERILMDWLVQLPLHWGRARLFLARGDPAAAHVEATALINLASRSNDVTWLSLGLSASAEAAAASRDWTSSSASLARALALIEERPAPAASWRVHRTAASLARSRRRLADAAHHSKTASHLLRRLASTLPDVPGLAASLLAAAEA